MDAEVGRRLRRPSGGLQAGRTIDRVERPAASQPELQPNPLRDFAVETDGMFEDAVRYSDLGGVRFAHLCEELRFAVALLAAVTVVEAADPTFKLICAAVGTLERTSTSCVADSKPAAATTR